MIRFAWWFRRVQIGAGAAVMLMGASMGRPPLSAMGAIHVVIGALYVGRDESQP